MVMKFLAILLAALLSAFYGPGNINVQAEVLDLSEIFNDVYSRSLTDVIRLAVISERRCGGERFKKPELWHNRVDECKEEQLLYGDTCAAICAFQKLGIVYGSDDNLKGNQAAVDSFIQQLYPDSVVATMLQAVTPCVSMIHAELDRDNDCKKQLSFTSCVKTAIEVSCYGKA